jgi:hypothetical protein
MLDLTTTEAAAYLAARGFVVRSRRTRGVIGPPKADTIKRWCMGGKITARKVNPRLWLIPQDELDRFLAEHV